MPKSGLSDFRFRVSIDLRLYFALYLSESVVGCRLDAVPVPNLAGSRTFWSFHLNLRSLNLSVRV